MFPENDREGSNELRVKRGSPEGQGSEGYFLQRNSIGKDRKLWKSKCSGRWKQLTGLEHREFVWERGAMRLERPMVPYHKGRRILYAIPRRALDGMRS